MDLISIQYKVIGISDKSNKHIDIVCELTIFVWNRTFFAFNNKSHSIEIYPYRLCACAFIDVVPLRQVLIWLIL